MEKACGSSRLKVDPAAKSRSRSPIRFADPDVRIFSLGWKLFKKQHGASIRNEYVNLIGAITTFMQQKGFVLWENGEMIDDINETKDLAWIRPRNEINEFQLTFVYGTVKVSLHCERQKNGIPSNRTFFITKSGGQLIGKKVTITVNDFSKDGNEDKLKGFIKQFGQSCLVLIEEDSKDTDGDECLEDMIIKGRQL